MRIICRGVVRPAPEAGPGRRPAAAVRQLDQIREDADWLGEQGVTELFYDLNWDPQIGTPGRAGAAADRAGETRGRRRSCDALATRPARAPRVAACGRSAG